MVKFKKCVEGWEGIVFEMGETDGTCENEDKSDALKGK